MTESAKNPVIWPFWLELLLATVIPFVIWWNGTPTNILNSTSVWKLMEAIGIGGSVLLFFAGIPVGIVGIKAAKNMGKMRIATIVLSIINLSCGILEVAAMILVFCAVIFFRVM